MGEKICRVICMFIGGIIGLNIGQWYSSNILVIKELQNINFAGIIAVGIMFGYLVSPVIYREIISFNTYIEKIIKLLTAKVIISSVVGLIIGLLLANILLLPLLLYFKDRTFLFSSSIILNILFGYLGLFIGGKIASSFQQEKNKKPQVITLPKILDTSVIIDGRIIDIYKTGFLEGNLLVPSFVFNELRKIADSQDTLKRNRGRKGLDILKKMQEELGKNIEITSDDFSDMQDVDDKLIKLAEQLGGCVVTNDYNLNKSASLKEVKVLNINDLVNAVKSIALPGEYLRIQIIKEGKEMDQGIGYLDDGTMVVVEDAREYIGDVTDVIVTNILQTSAGRVIFAKIPREEYRNRR